MLILRGLGLGLCAQPLTVSSLWTIRPRDLPQASALSSVVRFVGSSIGVAVLSTTVQTQTKIHYSHLAELVTPSSQLGQLIPKLAALFAAQGADTTLAMQTAVQVAIRELQLQAYMLAMNDAFRLTLVFAVLAFISVIFVRGGRQRVRRPVQHQQTGESDQERRTREEATLAV